MEFCAHICILWKKIYKIAECATILPECSITVSKSTQTVPQCIPKYNKFIFTLLIIASLEISKLQIFQMTQKCIFIYLINLPNIYIRNLRFSAHFSTRCETRVWPKSITFTRDLKEKKVTFATPSSRNSDLIKFWDVQRLHNKMQKPRRTIIII